MRLVLISYIISLLLPYSLIAQNKNGSPSYQFFFDELKTTQPGKSKIVIQQDPRIPELIGKHVVSNKNQQINGLPGYRIRIFSDGSQSARQKMMNEKARFLKNFYDMGLEVYPDYKAPYWKIYVGDFRTRSQALKAYKEIQKQFPYAFIVNDYIKVPELN